MYSFVYWLTAISAVQMDSFSICGPNAFLAEKTFKCDLRTNDILEFGSAFM